MHAGKSDDGQDSSKWGCRLAEFYKNTFTRVSNTIPMNHWAHWRGHSGSFVLNALDNADSPDGFSYPNKAEVRFWIGCDGPDTTYPIAYQVGQIYPTVSDPPIRALIITGNTGYGVQNIGLGEGVVKTCSSPSTFVQVDRDYVWDITTGVRASRPSTCTAPSTGNSGDYYWSTDGGGNWDTSNGAGADGAADKCTATDTWTDDFYVPYQYPHELRAGGESPETATSRLPGQAKGTMWTHFSLFVILTLSLLGAIHYGRNRRTHSTA